MSHSCSQYGSGERSLNQSINHHYERRRHNQLLAHPEHTYTFDSHKFFESSESSEFSCCKLKPCQVGVRSWSKRCYWDRIVPAGPHYSCSEGLHIFRNTHISLCHSTILAKPTPIPHQDIRDGQHDDSRTTSSPQPSFAMNKLANMRHWSERMGPGFGMSRPNQQQQQQQQQQHQQQAQQAQQAAQLAQHQQQQQQQMMRQHVPQAPPQQAPPVQGHHLPAPIGVAPDSPVHLSFNVPFSSDLEGPIIEDIVHASPDAGERWTHPEDAPDDVPVHKLPIHQQNVANLKKLCGNITSGPLPIEAHVICSEPPRKKGRQVVNVCLTGSPELVTKSRETILNDIPLCLVSMLLYEA